MANCQRGSNSLLINIDVKLDEQEACETNHVLIVICPPTIGELKDDLYETFGYIPKDTKIFTEKQLENELANDHKLYKTYKPIEKNYYMRYDMP